MEETEGLKLAMQQLNMAIQKITELFYIQQESAGYQAFGTLLDPLSSLLDQLFSMRTLTGKPEFEEQKLLELLKGAMDAMEARDGVLFADILQYDLLEQFQEIEKQLP